MSLCGGRIFLITFFFTTGGPGESLKNGGDRAREAPELEGELLFASGRWADWTRGGWQPSRRRKMRKKCGARGAGAGWGGSPWASVAAGGQAHVCGCCFVLYNKLLEVREVADSEEPSTSQGPGRERRPGGQGPGGRTQEAVVFTPRSPARSQILRWGLRYPKEDMNNSCF